MNIYFEIDGVLNDPEYLNSIVTKTGDLVGQLDPIKVDTLRRLCIEDADIYLICPMWQKFGKEVINNVFEELGFTKEIKFASKILATQDSGKKIVLEKK